jgi:23S rRNA (pseudouridine1915-N3)-methyltransferase
MADEFVRRASRFARCEMREIQFRRTDPWSRHPGAVRIALDPAGKPTDSAGFVRLVARAEQAASDLIFLVGGASGLPPELVAGADLVLSLTPLTLPHELARVILAEQIYRAFTTLRGHPYPR